ncbi:hypothetical protein KKD61_02140 [Patescibacteria group bacterium]|nr:hypothetical protein [Patescibacteria group bacterium]
MGDKPLFVKKTIDRGGNVILSSPVLANAGQKSGWVDRAKVKFPGERDRIDHELDHGKRDGKRGRGGNPARISCGIRPDGKLFWLYDPVGRHGGSTKFPGGGTIGRSPKRVLRILSTERMSLGDFNLYRTLSAMVSKRAK